MKQITAKKCNAKGEYELRVGCHVAYGSIAISGDGDKSYSLDHAPTQADYDAVAAALDSSTDAELVEPVNIR